MIRLPRWLGIPNPKTPSRNKEGDDQKAKPAFLVYEWDEHRFTPKPQETRHRAENVMQHLPERGVILILGVPGQGKSTLLREWQNELERPALLAECRSLNTLNATENILEILFQKGVNGPEALRDWQQRQGSVLLVDALDELSANEDWENELADAIREAAEVPNQTVVMSCRTHVWQDRLEKLFRERKVNIQQTYTLLGFTPTEQLEYLTRWAEQNGHPQQEAETLAKNLAKHPQLRSLAANALLLELIATVALNEKLQLPASRSEFYQKTIEYMWKQKRETRNHAALIPARDQFLRTLGLKSLEPEKGRLNVELSRSLMQKALDETLPDKPEQKTLLELLQKIGLLVEANPNTSELRFVHLTFQEFALAQGLICGTGQDEPTPDEARDRLEQALVRHWDQPGLEPTLALAVAIAAKYQKDLSRPFQAMLDSWEDGRPSALVQAMHLYTFSAITDSSIAKLLIERLPEHAIAQYKVAGDELTPREVLERLGMSTDSEVFLRLAANPNTSPKTLEKIASFDILFANPWLAGNPNTPLEILMQLTSNTDPYIIDALASNPSFPVQFSIQMVISSKDSDSLHFLARNPETPVEVLKRVDFRSNLNLLAGLASNPSTPTEILFEIAENSGIDAFFILLSNPNFGRNLTYKPDAIIEILLEIAKNSNLNEFFRLFTHPYISIELLKNLSIGEYFDIYSKLLDKNINLYTKKELHILVTLDSLTENPSFPIEFMERLISIILPKHSKAPRKLAGNPNTPTQILTQLALSEDSNVLEGLASNPNTPVQILEQLAFNKDYRVLQGLASNPNTPIEILSNLMGELDTEIWDKLASNPNTPSHLLEALLTVDSMYIAAQIAENPATEAYLLKKMAANCGPLEYGLLAKNPKFVLEWLQPPPKTIETTRHLGGHSVEEIAFGGGPVSLDKNRWKLPSGRAKVRILFLRSDPGDASRLDLSGESGQITITLERAKRQQLHLEPLDMTTVEEVGRALSRIEQPTILHFAGHGSPDGKMYWRKSIKENSAYPIPVEVFAKMIAAIKDHKIVCVFLNACYLASEAKHLLQHVPYVIASRTAIADTAAIDFSSGFYTWLGEGKDIGESFNYALSLVEANLPGLQEHLKPVLLEREASDSN